MGLMMRGMTKGPTYRGASFRVPPRMGMSLVESHTRWPTRYSGAGFLLLPPCCFIRAAAFCRLARVALQVHLHRRMKASADWTPTCSSWLGNRGGWYPRQHSKGERLVAAETWRVHGVLHPRQLRVPGGGVLSAEAPENRLQRLVRPLGLAIRLRMKAGG